jgi:shikimate dehydrogenase
LNELEKSERDFYVLMGRHTSASPSPAMMNAGFEALSIKAEYRQMDIKEESLESRVLALKAMGVNGMNITAPYKCRIVDMLDDLEGVAVDIRAVNTVKRAGRKLIGYNTDIDGVLGPLREGCPRLAPRSAIVLGAGGAARAFVAAMHDMKCQKVLVLVREPSRTTRFFNDMTGAFPDLDFLLGGLNQSLTDAIGRVDILFNATPLVNFSPRVPISIADALSRKPVVFDAVYNPIETGLIAEARANQCKVIHGYQMLVAQGAASFEIWTGKKAPVELMRHAVLNFLRGGCRT